MPVIILLFYSIKVNTALLLCFYYYMNALHISISSQLKSELFFLLNQKVDFHWPWSFRNRFIMEYDWVAMNGLKHSWKGMFQWHNYREYLIWLRIHHGLLYWGDHTLKCFDWFLRFKHKHLCTLTFLLFTKTASQQ